MMNIINLSRVKSLDKIMFTKHLSIMVKSGVSIYEALDTIASSITSPTFRAVLYGVLKAVENGKSLSEALMRYPQVFDRFYTSLIKVSEDSGTLEETMHYLSVQLEKEHALRKKIQGAMFYPVLVAVMSLGIGGFISIYILPQLVDFFDNLEIALPLPTLILLKFANLMKFHGIEIIITSIILGILFRFLISTRAFKPVWQGFLIRIPIFGKIIIYNQLTRFTRNLSVLIKSGVPLVTALSTASDAVTIVSFKEHVGRVEENLIRGKNISETLQREDYKEFPSMTVKMIRIGEKTGTLESVLMYLSDFYEEEIDNTTKNLSTILEPIMLIGIGLVVGFIAVAIIGPIYEITGSISQ